MTTETSPLLAAALGYTRRGFSVIPLKPRDKRPALQSWKDYQSRCATEDEVRAWWQRMPNANVGIVTGTVSGLVVLDVDGEAGIKSITDASELLDRENPAPSVRTGKGWHFYFRHPGNSVRNFARKLPGIDLRGDGGFVVAPPSVHESGAVYAFAEGSDPNMALRPPTAALMQLIRGDSLSKEATGQVLDLSKAPDQRAERAPLDRYVTEAVDREIGRVTAADDGARNDTLNRAAFSLGQLIGAGAIEREHVEQRLLMAATRAGLSEVEGRSTIKSGLDAGIAQPRDLSAVGNRSHRDATVTLSGAATHPASRGVAPIEVAKFRLDRFTAGEPPARQWLTRGGLQLGIAAAIFGPGGVGKSMAILDLGLKVATRSARGPISDPMTFLGPVPIEAAGAAIFVTMEDDTAEIHRRANAIDPTRSRDGWPFYVVPGLDIPGFDPTMVTQVGKMAALTEFATEGLDSLIERVATDAGVRVKLVALDPAGDLINGSEDDAAVVKPLMRRLREISTRHACTIVLVGHTAKGQLDGDKVGERGMRGSGAWTANARAGFGLWRPDEAVSAKTLKQLDIPVTAENIERVVFGRMTKANAPTCLKGIRKYLQDTRSGLLVDVTDDLREKTRDDAALALDLLVAVVKEAADLYLPYQLEGQAGLYKRRSELPEPLKHYALKRIRDLGNAALDAGLIEKCRAMGSSAPCWLDVPGGPFATGLQSRSTYGSLAEARKAARRPAA